jgi:hypothetical protein
METGGEACHGGLAVLHVVPACCPLLVRRGWCGCGGQCGPECACLVACKSVLEARLVTGIQGARCLPQCAELARGMCSAERA